MTHDVPRFALAPLPNAHPDVGRWLDMLQDARKRTRGDLYGFALTDAELDAAPAAGVNTIGAVLYHIAASEAQWAYQNLLDAPLPDAVAALLPYPMLDAAGRLSTPRGMPYQWYVDTLNSVREHILTVFAPMSPEEFRTPVRRTLEYGEVEFTPEAVVVHLAQHEAEHRGQIHTILDGVRGRSQISGDY